MSASKKPISAVVDVNPRIPVELSRESNRMVDFVPMAQLSEQGMVTPNGSRPLQEVIKGYTYFANGDVLVAKITPCMENGKAAYVDNLPHAIGFGSTEFHVLRPGATVDGRYLFYMVWNPVFRNEAEDAMTGSAGQKRIPSAFFDRFTIPLPPLSEQKRIAHILDKAEAIRRKRQEAINELDSLTIATYFKWFGLPTSSPTPRPLGDCVTIVSGGTPSKGNPDFWEGNFPWVSPKDMKVELISDAEDHVTELAFKKTTLKRIPEQAILVVVRGMILAHTVPIALTASPVAINQDIKALLTNNTYQPEFLYWTLRAAHNYILSKVSTAAHGTKRLEVEHLVGIPVPVVSESKQLEFVKVAHRIRTASDRLRLAGRNELFNSLVQRAFKGEL